MTSQALERGTKLSVRDDCIGWAVKSKGGEFVSDGGGTSKPVDLRKDEVVTFKGVVLDVEPLSYLVERQGGDHVEVRSHFVQPA